MQNILIIARRDLNAQFNSPVAYVVIGGTMLIMGILFFFIPHTGVFGASVGGFWEIDHATVEQMFVYLPVLLSLFVVPAVTMRTLAAEKGLGLSSFSSRCPCATPRSSWASTSPRARWCSSCSRRR